MAVEEERPEREGEPKDEAEPEPGTSGEKAETELDISDAEPKSEPRSETEPDAAEKAEADAGDEAEDEAASEDVPSLKKEAGSKDEGRKDEEKKEERRPRPVDGRLKVATALTAVAALCAAWFGWSWYAAAHDESLAFARERDDVLRAGEQAVQNLNTLDHRSLDQGLKVWQDSSTSELYQQIVQGRPQFEKAVQQSKTITSAKVLDAAVTELDQHAGKASVIVGLQITVTPPKGDPTVKKSRLVGQLTRTSTGWKLSALSPAPVGSSG